MAPGVRQPVVPAGASCSRLPRPLRARPASQPYKPAGAHSIKLASAALPPGHEMLQAGVSANPLCAPPSLTFQAYAPSLPRASHSKTFLCLSSLLPLRVLWAGLRGRPHGCAGPTRHTSCNTHTSCCLQCNSTHDMTREALPPSRPSMLPSFIPSHMLILSRALASILFPSPGRPRQAAPAACHAHPSTMVPPLVLNCCSPLQPLPIHPPFEWPHWAHWVGVILPDTGVHAIDCSC